jgi:predicted amidohydrolase
MRMLHVAALCAVCAVVAEGAIQRPPLPLRHIGTTNSLAVAAVQMTPASGANSVEADGLSGVEIGHIVSSILARDGSVAIKANTSSTPDLVVFPEYALLGNWSTDVCSTAEGVAQFNQNCFPVPNAGGEISCDDSSAAASGLHALVCGPNSTVYASTLISVNVCERCDGDTSASGPCAVTKSQAPAPTGKNTANTAYFNTQVVVRGRRVVQTYRKMHPWATSCYDTPAEQLRAFNVTNAAGTATRVFGLFTCFDIMFPQPSGSLLAEGISAFSYSSAIPLIGRDAVRLFGLIHGATMVNSNLQYGQTAVSVNGTVIAECETTDGTCAAIADI